MTDQLAAPDREALLRWRLALGSGAESAGDSSLSLGSLCEGNALGLGGERIREMDGALGFVYGSAGSGQSRAYIPQWLSSLREFFSHDVIAMVQKDAIERKGLTELLFEPETLPLLEKNVELVTTLMSAKNLIPDKAREMARQIVREVVDELRKKLEMAVRTAIYGALRRDRHSPMKLLRNMDWKRTIRSNLKGWDAERKRLIPERLHFWANQRRHHEWDVVLVVDQSGSMAQSVVYSSVMAAIFASLDVLKTRLLFFDTQVVDMTPYLVDPVELLFLAQLGGGTDINRAVAYAQQHFIERPEKTLFLLITDLFEGGNKDELVSRVHELVDSRVKAICLLALSDSGRPSYDHGMAQRLADVGVPCFGCTPARLVEIMERLMKNQEIATLINQTGRDGHG